MVLAAVVSEAVVLFLVFKSAHEVVINTFHIRILRTF